MRAFWLGVAAVLMLFQSEAAWAQSTVEPNVDRPGGDYRNFDIRGGSATCRSACEADRSCVAWTFVRKNVQGPSPRCWLKTSVGPPTTNTCCVSGILTTGAGGVPQGGTAAPAGDGDRGDCCPNNMLVCPAGRHFCASPGADADAARRQPYNPAWQAAPGDTRCCPTGMLVCPAPRRFCSP